MSEAAPGLSRAEILRLLDLVALEAQRRELDVSLFLVGGAAMALAYSTSRATRDLDGAFEPKAAVYEIARVVASQVPELALREDWLNDAVKAFMPGEDVDATVHFDKPGLAVRVASPRYLFVMKAIAARESDLDDLRLLYGLCGYRSADAALNDVVAAYPRSPIKASVQYLLEGIAAEQD